MTPGSEAETPPDQKLDLSQIPDQENNDAKAYIQWWEDRILKAKQYWSDDYKKMKEDSDFIDGLQWPNQEKDDDRYVVNICQSEVTASVSTLYAKNPTFTVKRKPKLDFAIWDEDIDTLRNAQLLGESAIASGQPLPPEIKALMDDVNQGKLNRSILDKTGKTLEIVFDHQLAKQHPTFKGEMKQVVRRVETHGAAFIKLNFQRVNQMAPEDVTKIADLNSRLKHIENLSENQEGSAGRDLMKEREELQNSIKSLQEQEYVVASEGLTYHFPRAPMLIVDPACTQLRGFLGARFLAEEFHLTRDQIKEVYGLDVGASVSASAYCRQSGSSNEAWSVGRKRDNSERDYDDIYRVWEVYHLYIGS